MMRRTIALFVCMILCGMSFPADTAEISCGVGSFTFTWRQGIVTGLLMRPEEAHRHPASSCGPAALLTGKISKGDYEKVLAFVNAHRITLVALNSSGGNVDEALKIGRLFRRQLIGTLSAENVSDEADPPPLRHICASACALIWFGGVDREGWVGVHRPTTNDASFRESSPDKASTEYRRELEDIDDYLNEMEVPKSIVELMVNTSSADLSWVDATSGLRRPPSIAEWEDASCGSNVDETNDVHAECVKRVLSKHRDEKADFFPWRYLSFGGAIVVLIWLIIHRLRVSASTLTTETGQDGKPGREGAGLTHGC